MKLYNTPLPSSERQRNRRIRSCLRTTRWITTSWIRRPYNCWTPPVVTATLHLICNSHWPLNQLYKSEGKLEPKGFHFFLMCWWFIILNISLWRKQRKDGSASQSSSPVSCTFSNILKVACISFAIGGTLVLGWIVMLLHTEVQQLSDKLASCECLR